MTILFTILTVLAIQSPQAGIETLDGARYVGELRALSVENAQIETAQGLETVPTNRLMRIGFPKNVPSKDAAATNSQAKIVVTLVDGSKVLANDYRVEGENAKILRASGSEAISVTTHDISAIRFVTPATEALADEWEKLLEESADSDRLVVAKDNSFDYHSGVIGDVSESRVTFSLDGEPMNIKREKIFGVMYYHAAGRTLPKSLGRMTTVNGDSVPFTDVTLDGENFKLTTVLGLELVFATNTVECFNFAEGKIAFLSDMKPESIEWTPYFTMKSETDEDGDQNRATFFGPKFGKSSQQKPLLLDKTQYEKGLEIHSRSVITYRLGKKYGRLTTIAGIADRVRPQGHVQLKIEADNRVLFDSEISGTDPATPIDLELAQADRLTITVDYGLQTDIADHLILGDAKVME